METSPGATEVVDYTREDFTRIEASYDSVLDLVGNPKLRELRHIDQDLERWTAQ